MRVEQAAHRVHAPVAEAVPEPPQEDDDPEEAQLGLQRARRPVALGIPDYPAIIKHPMDLRTIEGMLTRGEISTPDEFTALCRTVFRNAFVYNKPGQPDGGSGSSAERLSLVFEKEIAKM